uniref:Uncharacterized protein TCIL3000_10_8470 n=1 Tax=Trypanosoma congolense (strain IL3000) TaxID=1068625 RepID=G0UXF4_TRYCI|nr:unnamed protein product [Trypanosoma congolense IL3000]
MKSNIVSSSLCNIGMGILKVARAAAVAHGIPAGVVPPDDVFNEMSTRQGGSPTTVKPSPLPDDLRAQLHSTANEKVGETTYRAVPSSRTARAAGFGSLLIRLGWDKFVGARESGQMLSVSSHQRIVETLCRMRGAVLKLGQMLSIQDDSVVPAHVTRLFERVRDSAYAMPTYQLNQTMTKEYDNNPNWQKDLFESLMRSPLLLQHGGRCTGRPLGTKIVASRLSLP